MLQNAGFLEATLRKLPCGRVLRTSGKNSKSWETFQSGKNDPGTASGLLGAEPDLLAQARDFYCLISAELMIQIDTFLRFP